MGQVCYLTTLENLPVERNVAYHVISDRNIFLFCQTKGRCSDFSVKTRKEQYWKYSISFFRNIFSEMTVSFALVSYRKTSFSMQLRSAPKQK